MKRKLQVAYVEPEEGSSRLGRLSEILAEGVYGYLRGRGLLRQEAQRGERVEKLLRKAKELAGLRDDSGATDSAETS